MKISSFGEVLWDDFPEGKVLGGAPLNVLVRLSALGADCAIVSRRGSDEDGEELLRRIAAKNVATHLIQTDPEHATGLVKVSINHDGSGSYDIVYPCAWDKIAVPEAALEHVADSDALVFGSLSSRDAASRAALDALLDAARFKVFDVNLRKPHYQPERVCELMRRSDLVKLNDDELYELAAELGSPYHGLEQNLHYLAQAVGAPHICVTLGAHGAIYYCNGQTHAHHGYRVQVADTVGAGDNFLAGFVYKLLSGASPADTLAFACAWGALAASHHGATPELSLADVEELMNPSVQQAV